MCKFSIFLRQICKVGFRKCPPNDIQIKKLLELPFEILGNAISLSKMFYTISQTNSILNSPDVFWKQKNLPGSYKKEKIWKLSCFKYFMKCLVDIFFIQHVDFMYELMCKHFLAKIFIYLGFDAILKKC